MCSSELELAEGTRNHLVFPVSQLRKRIGPSGLTSSTPPGFTYGGILWHQQLETCLVRQNVESLCQGGIAYVDFIAT